MNILQVHKYFWPRDGASKYMLFVFEELKKKGHTVIPFTMKQKETLRSPFSKYFVTEMKLDSTRVPLKTKISYASKIFYNREAHQKTQVLLDDHQIDVAHLHNIYHHISPSILKPLKKRNIPIVMTLHDYKMIAPNYTLYHHGSIHEEDASGMHTSCITNKCHKDSRAQSTLLTAEMIFHHKIMRYYEKYVDAFIAPSQFMKDMLVKYGWDADAIFHVPHPIDTKRYTVTKEDRGYVAYAGRLSEEKGIRTLIHAASLTPEIPYRIIGDGPLLSWAETYIQKHKLTNVTLTGYKTGAALTKLMKHARLHVLPSEWYENYPLAALEAQALGKVIISTRIGGIPELVAPGQLTAPKAPELLADMLRAWFFCPEKRRRAASAQARARVEKVNDPQKHLEKILSIYKSYAS